MAAVANAGIPSDITIRADLAVRADHHVALDEHSRQDAGARTEVEHAFENGRRMDLAFDPVVGQQCDELLVGAEQIPGMADEKRVLCDAPIGGIRRGSEPSERFAFAVHEGAVSGGCKRG